LKSTGDLAEQSGKGRGDHRRAGGENGRLLWNRSNGIALLVSSVHMKKKGGAEGRRYEGGESRHGGDGRGDFLVGLVGGKNKEENFPRG